MGDAFSKQPEQTRQPDHPQSASETPETAERDCCARSIHRSLGNQAAIRLHTAGGRQPASTLHRAMGNHAIATVAAQSIQRQDAGEGTPKELPEEVSALTRAGGGRPLDPTLGEHYGSTLRANFDDVRVHTGPRALAYTSSPVHAVQPRNGAAPPGLSREYLGMRIQAKLAVSAPGDPFEQEADHVAAQVMRTPQACTGCKEDEEMHTVQPIAGPRISRAASVRVEPSVGADAALRASERGGAPLSIDVRSYFETRFGHDFSQVRVHADHEAADGARAVQARAYTVGRNVVFGSGEYAPATMEGKHLLAHELVHVVQQGFAPARRPALHDGGHLGSAARSTRVPINAPPTPSPAAERIARQEKEPASSGSTVGYVAIYLGGGEESNGYIDFHTKTGMFRYQLDDLGDLKAGEYQTNVVVKGNNVDFTLDVTSGQLFGFSYRIAAGQPNPKTFFAHQSTVTFTVTDDVAPPLHNIDPTEQEKPDPNVVYLPLEEALRRCESGDMKGVKVFPYRGTRFGGAPLTVFRDGNDIVVKSYVTSVLGNKDFQKQTRTLPTETFIGGVRLKPNEVVRVHTYEPRWYHLNITGSTSGDIEDEFCVTGEGMLKIGEMSDSAVKWNAVLTVVDALSIIVPVGKLATIIGKPAVQVVSRGGRTLAAAMMLGLREAAPTAFAGIASRSATVLVEEQVVDQVASRAISQTASHAVIEFAQQPLERAAAGAAGAAAEDFGSGAAAQALALTVKVTLVDAAGNKIISAITTPTGDAALDKTINEAFSQTFDQSASKAAGTAAQGVVSTAPEIAAGFTQAQVAAFRRVLARAFDSEDIKVLQQLWDAAARPGDAAIINAGNSRYLFDLQRNRFWARVVGNTQAKALFTDAGCQFSGGAPYYMLNGRRITITIDHIIERQTTPNLALTASNLRLAFSRENSVVLRLLNQLDPFQH